MKVFKISAAEASYDEYKSVIVVAANEKRALEIAKKGQPYEWQDPNKYDVYWIFDSEQFPLSVTEISLDTERAVASELIGS